MASALQITLRGFQTALRRIGINVTRHNKTSAESHPIRILLKRYSVECIFDVGANTGGTGLNLRSIGYHGPIVSFEPVARFLPELREHARADPRWVVEPFALGDTDAEAEINVAASHGGASSFLEMTDLVRLSAPDQRIISRERVAVRRLDTIVDRHYPAGRSLFLKMDVQGYEQRVLAGAVGSMPRIVGIQTEMSLQEAYRGEILMPEMIGRLSALGYSLCWLQPSWCDPETGELLQVDGYFFTTKATRQTNLG